MIRFLMSSCGGRKSSSSHLLIDSIFRRRRFFLLLLLIAATSTLTSEQIFERIQRGTVDLRGFETGAFEKTLQRGVRGGWIRRCGGLLLFRAHSCKFGDTLMMIGRTTREQEESTYSSKGIAE